MENLLEQIDNHATITLYKNYCTIDKHNYLINNKFHQVYNNPYHDHKKNRAKLFFYIKEPKMVLNNHHLFESNVNTEKYTSFAISATEIKTYSDYKIKKYINEPFADVIIKFFRRKIEIRENKIILTTYTQSKFRSLNHKYFKKKYEIIKIIINKETHDITTLHKADDKKVKIRKNCFTELKTLIKAGNFLNDFGICKGNEYKEKLIELFGFKNQLNDELDLFYGFVDHFISKKNIKIYDNFDKNDILWMYLGKKKLLKNDNNLLNTFLSEYNIKTKSVIRKINENDNLDLPNFLIICKLIGKNIGHVINHLKNDGIMVKKSDISYQVSNKRILNHFIVSIQNINYDFNKYETKSLVKYLNAMKTSSQFTELIDHLRLIKSLREYGEVINFSFKDNEQFNEEHFRYSQLSMHYKKEYYTHLIYDDRLLDDIENNSIDKDFYFSILKNDNEYNDEGNYMHHCVSTYINRDDSMIISIRCHNSRDRVTCEYDIQTGILKQAKYFTNQPPPEHFEDIINVLSKMIKKHNKMGTLKLITKSFVKNDKVYIS